MAANKGAQDALSNALADYFYIAGIEYSQIFDETLRNAVPTQSAAPVETTIDEETALITDGSQSPRPTTPGSLGGSLGADTPVRRSKRYSWEVRKSMGSAIFSPDADSPSSKRTSSATIRGPSAQIPNAQPPSATNSGTFSEEDFEQALRKFATERDSFLEDIHVSAGTVASPQTRAAKPRPKTMRILSDDLSASGLRGGVGSIRRRLSTMNSVRKATPPTRHASVYTSKRLSDYKSVIPAPEPFKLDPNMHPLRRRYEPVLLDRYPTSSMVEESKKRCAFPNFVPMFAFPYDAHVVSSDERPRSTWHGFAMTEADGSKVHSICVTVWTPLGTEASAELERQCDAWRRANMTEGEREMAASLGERLVAERAKLSRLLSRLPTVASESIEREDLEETIGMVEERITLMADLLRPVRHAAASKIEGLTQNETGFWVPRVYGVLGKDGSLTSFWKEWLKAIVVPMSDGGVLNVPPSSPRVGMWQPLERYVVNLCMEAPSPLTSLTQTEVVIRELKLYARHDAINELPGTRNTDLYALFRALSIPTIVALFEAAVAEGRIILLSSHTSMLHLASSALCSLLYPLKWSGVFIPVLPARLLQALEAPCPYIIGIERRYDNLTLPDDDFFMVDLDQDIMEGTAPPRSLPRQIRRKLTSLLQAAAPHHNRFGVAKGPPAYAVETFPMSIFSSENPQVFDSDAKTMNLADTVSMSSTSFSGTRATKANLPVFNAFVQARHDQTAAGDRRPSIRPGTSSTTKGSHSSSQTPPTPTSPSPGSSFFPPTPVSRNDSAFGIQTTLREKRSGQLDMTAARRSSSFGLDRINPMRRTGQPTNGGHSPSLSTSVLSSTIGATNGGYAASIYAPSTVAASTIMPTALIQPVKDNENQSWVEGHCMLKQTRNPRGGNCAICSEKSSDTMYCCSGCSAYAHPGCVHHITLVCPAAFRPALVQAAFVRCFASLLYTYRRFLQNSSSERRKAGLHYHFKLDAFEKSLPAEHAEYIAALRETQAFNEFIHERESKRAEDPTIKLFDEIIMSKRNRGKTSLFSRGNTTFLSDASDHLWRSAAAAPPSSRFPGDYRQVVSRIPAKLDPSLMKEPRANQGAPRIPKARTQRKPIPSMLGLNVDINDGAAATSSSSNTSNHDAFKPNGAAAP